MARCLKCELKKEENEFRYYSFCDNCYQIEGGKELTRFRNIFRDYGQEIFCLRYPDAESQCSVSIPKDNEGKKKMIEEVKKNIGSGLESQEQWHKDKEGYKDNVRQLNQYASQILHFEKQYK